VLCGGASALVRRFRNACRAGYQPSWRYFECLPRDEDNWDLMYESGIAACAYSISENAKLRRITRGPRVVNKQTKTV